MKRFLLILILILLVAALGVLLILVLVIAVFHAVLASFPLELPASIVWARENKNIPKNS